MRMPIHAIAAGRIEAQILAGEWAPGDRLSPERDLCRDLDVSRTTLRQALGALERRGLVTRQQGRGTFVANARAGHAPAVTSEGPAGAGRLRDRVILVTGSTGIAAAGARRFAAEGARIFVTSRTADHCAQLVAELSEAGAEAAFVAAELSDEAQVEAAIDGALARFGRLDGLFGVAGGSGRRFGDGPLHEVTLDGWHRTLDLNLTSQFLVVRAVLRQMLSQDLGAAGMRGALLLVGSVLARHPVPELFATHAYAAAKGAIEALVTTTAAFYAPQAIRVNAVTPGLVATAMSVRAAADPAARPSPPASSRSPAASCSPTRSPRPPSTSSPTRRATSRARCSPWTAAGRSSTHPLAADRRHVAGAAADRCRYAAVIIPIGGCASTRSRSTVGLHRDDPARAGARENGGADVREIVGFVMGAAAGAAGALFATSTEGRALLERLKDEARPETERAAAEWEPVLREVSRAVRLAVRELETATVDLQGADRRDRGGPARRVLATGARARAADAMAGARRPRPASTRRRQTKRHAATLRQPAPHVAADSGRPTMRRFIAQVVVNSLTILIVLFLFSLIKVDYTDPFTGVHFTGPALALGANPLAHAPVHGALRRARGGVRPADHPGADRPPPAALDGPDPDRRERLRWWPSRAGWRRASSSSPTRPGSGAP